MDLNSVTWLLGKMDSYLTDTKWEVEWWERETEVIQNYWEGRHQCGQNVGYEMAGVLERLKGESEEYQERCFMSLPAAQEKGNEELEKEWTVGPAMSGKSAEALKRVLWEAPSHFT